MQEDMQILVRCPLFAGCDGPEIRSMLSCLEARWRSFPKKTVIYEEGTEDFQLGVLVDGGIDVLQTDFWGRQSVMTRLTPGQIFAESFVLAHTVKLPVTVTAHLPSRVLFLEYRRMIHTCTNACPHHEKMIGNLLSIIARKNTYLTQKMEIMSKKTLREKLLAYLSVEAHRAGSRSFDIAYDRQALADYLAVDRSAMSRALGEMQKEGIVAYEKNHFTLLHGE